jgi:hypothetical protein
MKKNDEEYVAKKCSELLSAAGIESVPVNLDILGSIQGILRFEEMEMEEAGRLIPDTSGGYYVVVRSSDSEGKKRFTKAHEIGHTIVPDALSKSGHVDKEVGNFDTHSQIEYLCDYAAANLLMPAAIFNEHVKGIKFSLVNIVKTAEHFNVSIEAAALQFVKRNISRRAVVIWEYSHKPKEHIVLATSSFPGMEQYRPEKQIRVRYGYGLSHKNHIPKHKSLDEEKDLISKAFNNREVLRGTQKIYFREGVGVNFYCEAMMTLEGRVISILKLE